MKGFLIPLISSCLLTATAFAQDGGVGLGVSVGTGWLVIPGNDAPGTAKGVGSSVGSKDTMVFGPIGSAGAAFELGRAGDIPLFLRMQGFYLSGTGDQTTAQTISGNSDILLTSRAGPAGTVDLFAGTTPAGASASAQTVLNLPGGGTSVGQADVIGADFVQHDAAGQSVLAAQGK